ncbi:hypothetical protein [Fibrobacter sp.]|uniref:hypothetical protein n=1 Tax=Fibrobacter sp. TaxID=35828 RepID=UPI00387027EE
MKRIFLGMILAVSLCGFVGCAEYEGDDEDIHEKCLKDPNLPVCQENPGNEEPESNPSMNEDL